jgi:hypothetical protein
MAAQGQVMERTNADTQPQWFFVAQLLYKIASCFVKLSVLLFYLRIFPARYFRITAYIAAGIVVAYSIGSICATIWSCEYAPYSIQGPDTMLIKSIFVVPFHAAGTRLSLGPVFRLAMCGTALVLCLS